MYVKKVRTNAKVGADVTLGPKTLIIGPNGTGKSTIINAVELALTSRVSDVAGRTDVGREADVMQLAPRGDALFAEIAFDDGTAATYVVEGTTAKAKKAQVERPDALVHDEILPIRTLREALLGSPATARKYLLGKVAGRVSREDVEALMPSDALKEAWRSAVGRVPSTTSAPDALVAVLEAAGAAQREANAEAKAAREAGKLVTGGRAAPPAKAEITAATKARDAAREAWQRASSAQSGHERKAALAGELDRLVPRAEALLNESVQLGARLANLPTPQPPHPVFPHVCEVIKESLAQGECLVCGAGKPDASALKFLEEELAGYKTALAERTSLESQYRAAQSGADALVARIEVIEGEIAGLAEGGEVLDVVAAKAALDAAEQALTDLKVVADAWASARKAESAAKDAEAKSEAAKALKSACEDAVGIVLGKALEAFVARVEQSLPPGDQFDLRLNDGGREVVQFGLYRGESLVTALSGAEWARVVAAMSSACVPEGRYACVIPEERAFDPHTLTSVLEAFSACPHQVIIASPVAPASVPAGWTVVTRGG